MKRNKFLYILPIIFTANLSLAAIPEQRIINYENRISIPKNIKDKLDELTFSIYTKTIDKFFQKKYWGKYGTFSKVNVEQQGSLAYEMAIANSSDLDIAFVYKYNNGESMSKLNPIKLKNDAINIFKEVFGKKYKYMIKNHVINLSNNTDNIDIAFFNLLNKSKGECSIYNRCAELNYGKDSSTAKWYLSERLALYSKLDDIFTKNTEKRNLINRVGKILKVWREKIFAKEKTKIPSIALVTMLYDFSKEKATSYHYTNSIDTLRDITNYSITKYFKNKRCDKAANAIISLPIYQIDKNLLSKLSATQRINVCQQIVKFNQALSIAALPNINEVDAIKLLAPFIGALTI